MNGRIRTVFAATIMTSFGAFAATGEMGTGIPNYGVYANLNQAVVGSLINATINMPTGCTQLILSAATLTMDGYKIALSQITAASLTRKRVRFYAHAVRDGGCGIDYVQIVD